MVMSVCLWLMAKILNSGRMYGWVMCLLEIDFIDYLNCHC